MYKQSKLRTVFSSYFINEVKICKTGIILFFLNQGEHKLHFLFLSCRIFENVVRMWFYKLILKQNSREKQRHEINL